MTLPQIKEISKSLFKTYTETPETFLGKKHQSEETQESSSKTKVHGIIFKKSSVEVAQKKNSCNCKNSQCLKLYCQCFSKFDFCDPEICSCRGCANTKENEVL